MISNLVDARERARQETHLPVHLSTAEIPAATGEYQVEMVEDVKKLTVSLPGTGPVGRKGTFRLVFEDRYLLLVAFLALVLNWVNSTGEYILGRTVEGAAQAAVAAGTAGGLSVPEYIGAFYSDFFFAVNLVGLTVQLFLVSRMLKYFGVRVAVMVLPIIALFGYAVLAFVPILSLVRVVKIAENATDYSVQNTVRNVLFLPTSRDQKYKAKQAIDSFFVRAWRCPFGRAGLCRDHDVRPGRERFCPHKPGACRRMALIALAIGPRIWTQGKSTADQRALVTRPWAWFFLVWLRLDAPARHQLQPRFRRFRRARLPPGSISWAMLEPPGPAENRFLRR